MTRSPRLLAGTLVLALPLAAAAGCGAEKKRTVKQEISAAQSFLERSKAASFTLRFDDTEGTLARLMGEDVPPAVAQALVRGSITYVADPVGDATLKSVPSQVADPTDVEAALEEVNVAFVLRDAKAELLELRLVAGDLYAHVNLAEIGALAEAGGVDDVDGLLDEGAASMDPRLAQGLTDVRAGKWLRLPLGKYLDQLQELAGGFTGITPPSAQSQGHDISGLGTKAVEAVKPYVKVTDANDDTSARVLDVRVQARPALKALLGVLKAEKDLPFAALLTTVDAAEVDEHVRDGEARGTIRLQDGHLTQVAVDLGSLRRLATDPGAGSLAGVRVVLDVDDSAEALTAPKDLSSLDLGAVLDALLKDLTGSMAGTATAGGHSG